MCNAVSLKLAPITADVMFRTPFVLQCEEWKLSNLVENAMSETQKKKTNELYNSPTMCNTVNFGFSERYAISC